MRWEETRIHNLHLLESALNVLGILRELERLAPTDVPPDKQARRQVLEERIQRQYVRLEQNRFEVAVLGLEKSGKSTLLNAWLGEELLPNAPERCTYTTTEVWAAASDQEQHLSIEYLSPAEFEKQLAAKRAQRDAQLKSSTEAELKSSKDFLELDNEVKELDRMRKEIEVYLQRGKDEYSRTQQIRDGLQDVIFKNRARARAAKRIVLHTSGLRFDRDVVFFDVPGFNSPVSIHREQAEETLKGVDVILYAREARKINADANESRMLDIADREDPHVRLAGKTFVALTYIDAANHAAELADWERKARWEWAALPQERIVPVCPVARLATIGACSEGTRKSGQAALERLRGFGRDDGMEALKQRVGAYIEWDRASILERRCRGLADNTRELAWDVLEGLRRKVPATPEEIDQAAKKATLRAFHIWWANEWKLIREEFASFYDTQIRMKGDVDDDASTHPSIEELRKTYEAHIDQGLTGVKLRDESQMKAVYQREVTGPGGVHQPIHAHHKIRRELHPEVMKALEGELSTALSNALLVMTDQMLSKAEELLWRIPGVREEMGSDLTQQKDRYKHGLTTLVLRFARVAVNLLVSVPRAEREKLVERQEAEVLALGHFDERTHEAFDLWQRAQGAIEFVLVVASMLRIIPGEVTELYRAAAKAVSPGPSEPWTSRRPSPFSFSAAPAADEFGSIAAEVREDLEWLRELLKSSVFEASGIVAYCHQELEAIRARFLELGDTGRWPAMVQSEAERGNPSVPFRFADAAVSARLHRELAEQLAKLREGISTLDAYRANKSPTPGGTRKQARDGEGVSLQ